MEKVFVSGGSGFISLHLISKLIQEGYKVRTSLRSLDRKQEVIDAVEKEVSTAGMLEFCELDLLKDEGWDEAVAGCDSEPCPGERRPLRNIRLGFRPLPLPPP